MLAAQGSVVGDGKPVRLVAHPLQHLQRDAVAGDDDGLLGLRAQEHFLLALCKGKNLQILLAALGKRFQRVGELTLASVDEDEVGRGGKALVVAVVEAFEPARQRLLHAGEIVVALHRLDAEFAVMRALGFAALEHRHARHFVRARDVRYVVRLNAVGELVQVEYLTELSDRALGAEPAPLLLAAVFFQGV